VRTILLILVVLALAGCVSNGGDTAPQTNTTNSTATGNMTMLPPKEIAKETFDFTTNPPRPPGPAPLPVATASKAVTVDPGYSNVTLNVTFAPANGAPAGAAVGVQGISVRIGNATCSLPPGPLQGSVTCTKSAPIKPGATTLRYSGDGPVVATVKVEESAP
jgi:hypothetical protein